MDWKLTGYKTYLGAAGLMLTALGKLASDYYNGQTADVPAFISVFFAGLGILGIGAKLARK